MTSTRKHQASIFRIVGRAGLAVAFLLVIISCGSPSTPADPGSPPPGSTPPPTPSTTVSVTPAKATLLRGETQQFTAKVTGASDGAVTWSAPVGYGSIDSTGLYTAPRDFDGGEIMVTASSNAVPKASGSATVTLPGVGFTVAPGTLVVVPGGSHTFSATVDGLGSNQVVWTLQGTGGGTITSTGLYTASSTTGLYSVVATSSVNTNYSASAAVLVTTTPSSFTPTGNVRHLRVFHTATLLADGRALVAGGDSGEAYCYSGTDSAELYDPVAGSFALAENMTVARYAQTSTLLQNGKVLVAGGFSVAPDSCLFDFPPPLNSAELYDPSNDSFAPTGNLAGERGGHTATPLKDNTVLIAGGGKSGGDRSPFLGDGLSTAEIYDPATGVFTSTGSMATGRVGQTATLLASGEVLIAGGVASALSGPVATAELYDPATKAFIPTGNMTTPRAGQTATVLQDGRVLIIGGRIDQTSLAADTAEIYDPATHTFVAAGSMSVGRWAHTATLLPNGTVLVVGGGTLIAEIYDVSTGLFYPSALTEVERSGHSATLLQNGKVIVIGGLRGLITAELYP